MRLRVLLLSVSLCLRLSVCGVRCAPRRGRLGVFVVSLVSLCWLCAGVVLQRGGGEESGKREGEVGCLLFSSGCLFVVIACCPSCSSVPPSPSSLLLRPDATRPGARRRCATRKDPHVTPGCCDSALRWTKQTLSSSAKRRRLNTALPLSTNLPQAQTPQHPQRSSEALLPSDVLPVPLRACVIALWVLEGLYNAGFAGYRVEREGEGEWDERRREETDKGGVCA